jgi:anti-sigma regulatory factor (Ser/Thr protein kinase)
VEEFAVGVASFVRDALAAGEAVMVAVVEPRAGALRAELGADADHVRFLDMGSVGRNPARIIPAWQAWSDEQRSAGRSFRGVGEPVWAGRSAAEIVECRQHEALLNVAFDSGPGWWLLCPYDTASLDAGVVEQVWDTHPRLVDGVRQWPELPSAALLADPLPDPAGPVCFETAYVFDDLRRVRDAVAHAAGAAGMSRPRSADLVLAVNELVGNTMVHGGGEGTLRVWLEGRVLVAEVRDRGRVKDPLIGLRKPTGSVHGGAGMWMVNQLCDLVQIRSSRECGTTVRIRMALDSAQALTRPA